MVSLIPRGARVAGRWHFPAPSSASAVAGWPSRSSADSARSLFRRTSTRGLRGLRSRSELLSRPGRNGFRPSSPGIRPTSTSLRAPPEFPCIGMASGVHSRATSRPRFGVEGATLAACSALVVLHHLGGFLLRKFAGLLHPAANPGVRRVSVGADSVHRDPKISRRARCRLSRDVRSLRRMSSIAAVPRHRGQSSAVESVTLHRRCQRCCVPSFLGMVPSKVLRAPSPP